MAVAAENRADRSAIKCRPGLKACPKRFALGGTFDLNELRTGARLTGIKEQYTLMLRDRRRPIPASIDGPSES